jgi:hypothetical protein
MLPTAAGHRGVRDPPQPCRSDACMHTGVGVAKPRYWRNTLSPVPVATGTSDTRVAAMTELPPIFMRLSRPVPHPDRPELLTERH